MRPVALFLAVLAGAATAPALMAQEGPFGYERRGPTRSYAGGGFVYGAPQGEFGERVDRALGAGGHLVVRLDRAGWLGMRAEGGFLNYGSESRRVVVSSTIGPRIQARLRTSNDLLTFGVGPQLAVPHGWVRPYLHGTVGLAYFVTASSLTTTRSTNEEPLLQTTHQEDAGLMLGGGAGLRIPITRGLNPVLVDLGARFQRSGEREYLTEGDITDQVEQLELRINRSETDLVTFHLGVSVGLNGRSRRR